MKTPFGNPPGRRMPFNLRMTNLIAWCATAGIGLLSTACLQAQVIFQAKPQPIADVAGEEAAAEEEQPLHDDTLSPFRFDAIDERTPFDPEVIRGLNEIEEFIAREEWPEVVESLQALIDRPETLLMPNADGTWRPLTEVVAERIGTLPPEGLRVYHQYFDAEAERLWQAARQNADIVQCGELASRFPLTPAGQQAADYIGSRMFDEGDYGGAALWFRRVWRARPELTNELAWRQRAAFAFVQVGDGELAKELFSQNDPAPTLLASTEDAAALEWLSAATPVDQGNSRLTDWRQWHGNERHVGTTEECRPILLRQWHAPATSRHLILTELDLLESEFVRHQRATMPAWPVTAVNGVAVSRTFRGIQVVETATGKLLWETDELASPERVLSGDLAQGPVDAYQMQVMGMIQTSYSSGQADNSMLSSFVYQDMTSGLLGSDGEQLFVLEDNSGQMQQPNPYFGWGMAPQEDLYGRDWSTNRLVSYDLLTGRRRWSIGGTQNNEVFDPHLAGTYFLGVPVCADGELYVVAEKDRMIQLLTLNSDTGELLWSCELVSTGSSIAQDIVRRLWACQPAVCGSVIICPTGLGWVMGIDRWQHSIVWSHRLTPRNDGSSRNVYHQVVQSPQPLGTRWFMAPPIVSGHRVLMTPIEIPDEFGIGSEPSLICLDAYTGEQEWTQPRGEYAQLAAVVNDLAVLVGPRVVAALSLVDGQQVWRADLEEGAYPRGRGLVAGDRFLLPISEGRLWAFNLTDGAIVDQQSSVVEGDQIGNIAIHEGMLLSSSPFGLSGYPLETTLQSWINERLAADPNDPEAALRMAEMALVSGDYERAFQLLPASNRWPDTEGVESEPRRRARELRRQLLVKIVDEDLQGRDSEFAELASISQNDEERIEVLKIEADRAMARQQWSEALDVYQSLMDLAGDRMVLDGPVEIRLDRLVSARMEDLWNAATPEVQAAINQHLEEIVAAARQGTQADRDRLMHLFAFHPASLGLMAWRAEDAGDAGKLVEAELLWNRLRASGDPQVAADATGRYAELLVQCGLYDDLRQLAREIPSDLGAVADANGQTLADRLAALVGELPERRALVSWRMDAPSDWSIERMNWQYYQQKQTLELAGDLLPSLIALEVSYMQNGNQRLQFYNSATDERWGMPVTTSLSGRNYYGYWPGLLADNHAIYGAYQDVISRISVVESDLQWATVTSPSNPTQVQRYPRGFSPTPLYPPESFMQSGIARSIQSNGGLLADANPFGVLCYGDDELILIDPVNGEIQWRLPGVPTTITAYLFGKVIYLIDDKGGVSFVVRIQDGRRLDSIQYVPSDVAQRAAFERNTSVPAAEVQQEETAQPQNRIRLRARPLIRRPIALPLPANGLEVPGGGEAEPADDLTPRVVSYWGDGLFAVIADRFVRIDQGNEQLWLSAVEPETGHQAWVLNFPAQVRLTLTRERLLFVLSKTDGRAWLVDLRDGTARELAPVAEELRGDHTAYVVTDSRSIFLVYNNLDNPQSSYGNLQSVQVHGTLVCWSRETGKLLWQRTVENQQLVLNSLEETPVLVLTSMQNVQKQVINYMESRVQLIDKQSGHVGLEDSWASMNGYINQFIVDPSHNYIELRGYNERVRMTPVVPAEATEQSSN